MDHVYSNATISEEDLKVVMANSAFGANLK